MGFDATFLVAVIGSPIPPHFVPWSENGSYQRALSEYAMMGEMSTKQLGKLRRRQFQDMIRVLRLTRCGVNIAVRCRDQEQSPRPKYSPNFAQEAIMVTKVFESLKANDHIHTCVW
jgi:hypothetical protein